MSLIKLPQNKKKERIISDYLFELIKNTLVHTSKLVVSILYPCLTQTAAGRGNFSLQMKNFAPAYYVIGSYQTFLKPNPNTMLNYGTLILLYFIILTVYGITPEMKCYSADISYWKYMH